MAFCTKCGAQLDDQAQICPSCGNEVQSVPSQQPAAANAEQSIPPSPAVSNKMSTGKILVLVIIMAVLGLVTLRAFRISGGSGKKTFGSCDAVVDAFGKAMTNADGELYYHVIYPKKIYESISENEIQSKSSIIADTNSVISLLVDGDKPKYEYSISEKHKMSADDLVQFASEYNYGEETFQLEEGYSAEVRLYLNGNRDSDTMHMNLVKIKGEGWKIAPSSANYITGANLSF